VADIAARRPDGSTVIGQRRIPALPIFDHAFSAFAQGTVFKTQDGFSAVEDLHPGDWLMTAQGGCEEIIWIGSAVFSSGKCEGHTSLTRVMPDSFGVNKPQSFVSFGPGARLLKAPPNLRGSTVAARMMTPLCRFQDGVSVIEVTPPTPVRLFHIAVRHHAVLLANGLEVESFHPGQNPVGHMSQILRNAYLSLFPHIEQLSDLGPMRYARAPEGSDLAETI
jgi:hypothetical protein